MKTSVAADDFVRDADPWSARQLIFTAERLRKGKSLRFKCDASFGAGVAEWQTQQTQNLPRFIPCAGSSPASGTKTRVIFF
jgi:hypothetical protein